MIKNLPIQFIPPVLIVMFLDCLFTLIGQDKSYWTNPISVNEGSPLGFSLMSNSPFFFILYFVFYLTAVFFILKKSPIFVSIPLSILIFIGHVWGSVSWMPKLFCENMCYANFGQWYLSIFYFLIISIISSVFIFDYLRKQK